jgi:hypothetical protein
MHLYRGEKEFNSLKNYIKKSFQKVPEKFWLKYIDEDNDEITISCTEDIVSLLELSKPPKIQVCEVSQSSESTESFEEISTNETAKPR